MTAATGLSALGIVTLTKVRAKEEIPFGMIPLLFGLQQGVEGAVWLSIQGGNVLLNSIASHTFVLFAYVLWPVFIPIAVVLLEHVPWRRKVLYILGLCGAGLGIYFLYSLTQFPVTGHVANNCIAYSTPHFDTIAVVILYVAATCLSLLISSHRTVKWFGVAATLSLLITYLFYDFALVSVWCFFAAILSCIVYFFFVHDPPRTT